MFGLGTGRAGGQVTGCSEGEQRELETSEANSLARGDHIFVWRSCKGVPFQHHAIDLGDGTVVHFTDGSGGVAGPGGDFSRFEVLRTSLDVVTRQGRDPIHVVEHAKRLDAEEVAGRAIGMVGRRDYDLLFDNCEHFATWCVHGQEQSRQVHSVCERLGSAGMKVAFVGMVRSASRFGAQRMLRGASPWLLAADAAQWATEATGHHFGLRNAQHRRLAGRTLGLATSLTCGAVGGPASLAVAGGLWAAGEAAGKLSRVGYDRFRDRRLSRRVRTPRAHVDGDPAG
jgi:hypothetical protein